MSGQREHRRLDRSALLGLAHPLRVQLFEALTSQGPATASELARQTGESSGSTSYHLRQLERHGFVETDPDRGTGRERWWRAVNADLVSRGADFDDDPAAAEAYRLLDKEWKRTRESRYDHWVTTRRAWPTEWRDAIGDTTSHFRLTLEEAGEMRREIVDLLERWAARHDGREGDPAYRSVEVQTQVFPNGSPPREQD